MTINYNGKLKEVVDLDKPNPKAKYEKREIVRDKNNNNAYKYTYTKKKSRKKTNFLVRWFVRTVNHMTFSEIICVVLLLTSLIMLAAM